MMLPDLLAKMSGFWTRYMSEVARLRDPAPKGGRLGNEWPTCHMTMLFDRACWPTAFADLRVPVA